MRIAQEEIFGPVQCCMPWRDADEVSTMLLVPHTVLASQAAHHAVPTRISMVSLVSESHVTQMHTTVTLQQWSML